jgi:hypothetical protein
MGIDAAMLTGTADRIALQAADQDRDRDHLQQPINAFGVEYTASLQLEDPRFLIAEQLLTAEALANPSAPIAEGKRPALEPHLRALLSQGLLEVCLSSPGWGAAPTVLCTGTAPDPWPRSPPPLLLLQPI